MMLFQAGRRIDDGKLRVRLNPGNRGEFAVIELTDDGAALFIFTPEEADRLIAAADEAWRLTPKGVEAVDAAVITDSERDCDERNPDGSGEPCHRGGDHGVHRDSNGDEWRADAADQVQYGNPFDNEGVWASCGTVWPDGGFVCTLAEGHDGQHQAWSHGEKMPFAVLDQAEASA